MPTQQLVAYSVHCENKVRDFQQQTKVLLFHPRNKRGQRIGTVVAYKKEGEVVVGFSKCNIKKDRFGNWIGAWKAINNTFSVKMFYDYLNTPVTNCFQAMMRNGETTDKRSKDLLAGRGVPSSLYNAVLTMIGRANRYFKLGLKTPEEKQQAEIFNLISQIPHTCESRPRHSEEKLDKMVDLVRKT